MNNGQTTVHPGVQLRRALQREGLSIAVAAQYMAVSRQSLHRVVAGSASISAEMAVRLERFLGTPARRWLSLQRNYDIQIAEQALAAELPRIPAWASAH